MRTIVLSLAFLLAADAAWAAGSSIGTATVVKGGVTVERSAQKGRWVNVQPGDLVFQGDKLKTLSDGVLKLTLKDDSNVSLSANSELELNEFVYQPGRERRSFFKLWSGKVRAAVSKYMRTSSVQIGTPTAVAGVRGTDFLVSTEGQGQGDETQVVVFEGRVAVKSNWERVAGEVMVQPGEMSRIGRNQAPAVPVKLDYEGMRRAFQTTAVQGQGTLRQRATSQEIRNTAGGFRSTGSVMRAAAATPRQVAPPINQQPVDATRDSALRINIKLPGQK